MVIIPPESGQSPDQLFDTRSHDGLHYIPEVTGPQEIRDTPPAPINIEGVSVPVSQHRNHLIRSLNAFAMANMHRGFLAAQHTKAGEPILQRYGDALFEVMNHEIHGKIDNENDSARDEFARALGIPVLILAGRLTKTDADKRLDYSFSRFKEIFSGTGNHKKLDTYRKWLAQLDEYSEGKRAVAPKKPKLLGTKPYDADPEYYEKLTTQGKLEALRDDKLAQFLPTTNREKNQAVSLLDYLNKLSPKAALHNQLEEVRIGQHKMLNEKQKTQRKQYDLEMKQRGESGVTVITRRYIDQKAEEAPVSIIYEFGDYLKNALVQTEVLARIHAEVDNTPNPHLKLAEMLEDLGELAPDPRALIRYLDVKAFRAAGKFSDFDPLLTTEDRDSLIMVGKNKVVEDPYTANKMRPKMVQHLHERIDTLTIKELRNETAVAVQDQIQRAKFWEFCLRNVGFKYRVHAEKALAAAGIEISVE